MFTIRQATAALGAAVLLATPATLVAAPANADGPSKDREFRVSGAEVDFEVSKDDGRFEIEVDIDDAKPGSRWRVVLRHDGKVVHRKVHRADREGDLEIEKNRRDTKGADVFKLRVAEVGGDAASRTIRMR